MSQHAGAVHRATAVALLPLGIAPRGLGALEALAAHGPLSQRAIGDLCRIDRTTMVAIMDDLEAAQLVDRAVDPENRRAHLVRLTRRAAAVLRQARQAARQVEADHCANLTESEREELVDILQRSLPPAPGCT